MKGTKIFLLTILIFPALIVYSQNKSLGFYGTSDGHVEVADNNLIDFTNNLTVEAWIYMDTQTGLYMILDKGWCGISDFSYWFGVQDGKLKHTWNSDGNCNFSSSATTSNIVIPIKTCTHVAIVHSNTFVKFYVNGVEVPSVLDLGSYSGIHASLEPLYIGIYKNLAGNLTLPLNGELDELRLWNTARTATEIVNNFNLALNGTENGLIAYYNFDNCITGNGNTVSNIASTGSALNGVMAGNGLPTVLDACEILLNLGVDILENNQSSGLAKIVYPNPALDFITLELNNSLIIKNICIIDACGKEIKTIIPQSTLISIPLESYDSGTYYLKINSIDGFSETKRFVKIQ